MAITINILYRGAPGAARAFAREMTESGVVGRIRAEEGNEAYDYFVPLDDPDALLLIDRWVSQEALDVHHGTPMMDEIVRLRDKYDLSMEVHRLTDLPDRIEDEGFIRH